MSGHDDRLVRRIAEAAAGRDPGGLCPDAEALGLYAERGLSGDELGHVEAHVAGCVRCQATVAAFVRSAPDLADVAGAAGSVDGVQRWWAGWRWLVPATATAAVLMLAVWVGRGPSEQAAESTRVAADPALAEQAVVPPDPVAPAPSAVGGGANVASPQTAPEELQKQLSARSAPVGRDTGPAAPAAVGALSDGRAKASPPAAFSAAAPAPPPVPAPTGAAPEARFERAQPDRQREAEARRDAAAEQRPGQMQAAAAPPPPPAVSAPAAPPPPAPAAVQSPPASTPVPLQEAVTVNPNAAAASAGRGARAAERNAAAGSEAMAKATASDAAKSARMVELTGRVTYRTRQALPAGATIEVRLLDVSRMDIPAQELGRTQVVTKGEQVPVPFAIPYDANAIEATRRYTVQATITIAGRVAFRTTTAPAVLTNGGPGTNVEVVVEPSR